VRLAHVAQVHPLVDAGASEYERRTRSRRAERATTASLAVPPDCPIAAAPAGKTRGHTSLNDKRVEFRKLRADS